MNLKKFIKNYNEWFSLPLAFALFFLVPKLYRFFDPTAGAFDAGVFHSAIYAIALLNLFSGVSWFLLWMKFPDLKKFLDDEAEGYLHSGTQRQQIGAITAFAIYFGYMILLYLITNTL